MRQRDDFEDRRHHEIWEARQRAVSGRTPQPGDRDIAGQHRELEIAEGSRREQAKREREWDWTRGDRDRDHDRGWGR